MITKQQGIYAFLRIIATGIALTLFRPYKDILFLVVLIVYFFRPLYLKIRPKRGILAAYTITYLAIICTTVLPFIAIVSLTNSEKNDFFETQITYLDGHMDTIVSSLNEYIPGAGDQIYQTLITPNSRGVNYRPQSDIPGEMPYLTIHELPVVYSLSQRHQGYPLAHALASSGSSKAELLVPYSSQIESMRDYIQTIESQTILINPLKSITRSIGYIVSAFFVFLFTSLYLFENREKLKDLLIYISPLSRPETENYIHKLGLMLSSLTKGILLASVIQGVLTGLAFGIVGISHVFIVMLVATVLYMVSIGAFVMVIPVTVYLIANGHIRAAIILVACNFVIGFIDNILKAYRLHAEVKMSIALLLIVTFSGVYFWGARGIFYGPLLMVIALTTYDTVTGRLAEGAPSLSKQG